jgi:hypothetical protein
MNDLMSGGMHRLWKDEFVRVSEFGCHAATHRLTQLLHPAIHPLFNSLDTT